VWFRRLPPASRQSLGTNNSIRLLRCITRRVDAVACQGSASRGPPLLQAFATLAPRPPAFADIFLYHRDSSLGTLALVQLLHAADESSRTSCSTEDRFLLPSSVLLDPALAKIVDMGLRYVMQAVCAIADIVSA